MVTTEHPSDGNEPLGVRDALARIDRRIDDLRSEVNSRIDDLRADVDTKLKLLMWGIGIGFAAVLATLGALLARGS
ncbi:MAG: hypothetical protein OXN86_03215 [Chloroflexota bacterium]|nr:hypothetical protein [Chloroflexota bacterium]MDE2891501.1 hypothetical protein [Chloroflexota bacterium]